MTPLHLKISLRGMCNLYRMNRTSAEIANLFKADDHWRGELAKHYVAPGREGPVVIERDGHRIAGLMTWGIPNRGKPVTNVRNLDSPFWRGMLDRPHHRCLVPAIEFEEWSSKADPTTGKKRPYWFTLPSRPVFAFAGIWRKVDGQARFAFLTTEPNSLIAPIHPKAMPVILDEADYDLWLTSDWPAAGRLVAPYPSQLMTIVDRP